MKGVDSDIQLVERFCLNEWCPFDQSKTYRFNRITYGKAYADSLTTIIEVPQWTSSNSSST